MNTIKRRFALWRHFYHLRQSKKAREKAAKHAAKGKYHFNRAREIKQASDRDHIKHV